MSALQVLHIEDNDPDAIAMRRWLANTFRPYQLDQVATLADGMARGKKRHFDVILLDLSLPDGQGADAITRMRKQFPHLPIIVVTGNTDTRQAENFVEFGADDYLVKSDINSSLIWKSIIYSVRKKKYEQRLAKQADELKLAVEMEKRANQAKSIFLAHVSHDLRTPVGVILGYSEILAKMNTLPETAIEYIERIKKNSETLIALINDLLDLSKIESGHLELSIRRFNLINELKDILANYYFKAFQKGIEFDLIFNSSIPKYVSTDRIRMRQILDNVISNAIKFTEQGFVHVCLKVDFDCSAGKLIFDVIDSGCGISKSQAKKIFEPFSQGHSEIHYHFGGTGLGLALARQLAQAFNGDVILLKSAIGKGSVFRIILPLEKVGKELIANPKQRLLENKAREYDKSSPNSKPNNIRILLAEDNIDNQVLVEFFLKTSGFSVDIVNNGQEAVAYAMKNQYDIILMDMQMPIMDGIEAVKILRSYGYTKPIIALTAFAMASERDRCLINGCDGYIAKPVTMQALSDKIHEFYQNSQSQDPLHS